jgi:aspartate 1-decarboxylase
VTDAEARELEPKVVFVDADNRIAGTSHDPADALPGELDALDGRDVSRGDLRTHLLRGDVVHHPADEVVW